MDIYDSLTNDAKFLISSMYKSYISRRKEGISKRDATSFGSSFDIQKTIMPEWSSVDVEFTLDELKEAGLIKANKVNGGPMIFVQLSPLAIAISENKFKDRMDEVLSYATRIKSLISFI